MVISFRVTSMTRTANASAPSKYADRSNADTVHRSATRHVSSRSDVHRNKGEP
jgi:hypothetical protein